MAAPRVFVSSTFYDLCYVRNDIEVFLKGLGYTPVMHDKGNIPYTQGGTSVEQACYDELATCDIAVCIIGGKYGTQSSNSDFSITMEELQKAVEGRKKIYVYILKDVYVENLIYEKNKKNKGFKLYYADDRRIHEFITLIKNTFKSVPIQSFESAADITSNLRQQFAGMLQRLLSKEATLMETKTFNELSYTISLEGSNIVYNNKEFSYTVTFTDNPNVVSVDFYIDGRLDKTLFGKPFTYKSILRDIAVGKHSINVVAKLQEGVFLTAEKRFDFQVVLGDEYQGGVVIKLSEDKMHGTIAAKTDLEGGIEGKYKYGCYGRNYGSYSKIDGVENTKKFEGKTDSNFAAIACLNYQGGGYDDWYLPALEEFDDLKKLEDTLIQSRLNNLYWTSTLREDEAHAEIVGFGRVAYTIKDLDIQKLHYVRPFRRF